MQKCLQEAYPNGQPWSSPVSIDPLIMFWHKEMEFENTFLHTHGLFELPVHACCVTWEKGWSADATTSILIDYMYVTFPPTWPNPSSDCHGVSDNIPGCVLIEAARSSPFSFTIGHPTTSHDADQRTSPTEDRTLDLRRTF